MSSGLTSETEEAWTTVFEPGRMRGLVAGFGGMIFESQNMCQNQSVTCSKCDFVTVFFLYNTFDP